MPSSRVEMYRAWSGAAADLCLQELTSKSPARTFSYPVGCNHSLKLMSEGVTLVSESRSTTFSLLGLSALGKQYMIDLPIEGGGGTGQFRTEAEFQKICVGVR